MHTKACISMGLSQFELSKITLKNLNKFNLSPTAKLVLLALIDCYNPKNGDVFPKQKTIADNLGVSERSVIRTIKEITNVGLLIYERKTTNRYKMTLKFFEALKMSPASCQNIRLENDKLSPSCHEQIKEQKKNNDFSKISELSEKRQYHHNNQQTGMSYKTPEQTQTEIRAVLIRDDKSPMTDKKTALKFIQYLQNEMNNPIIKMQVDKVREKWKIKA